MNTIIFNTINFLLIFIFSWTMLLFCQKISPVKPVSVSQKILLCFISGLFCVTVLNYYSLALFNIMLIPLILIMFFAVWSLRELHLIIYFTNVLILNILTIRMIVTSFFALITGNTIEHVIEFKNYTSELSFVVTLVLLTAIILFINHILSDEMVFNISMVKHTRVGLNIWIAICNAYIMFMYTSNAHSSNTGLRILQDQFTVCFLILIANWSFFAYTMYTIKLLRFKDENVRMQELIEGLTSTAVYRYSVNLSRDIVLSHYPVNLLTDKDSYTDTVNMIALRFVHPKDADKLKDILDRDNLISCYKKGKKKIEFELRIKDKKNSYVWYHINTILSCEEKSTNCYAYMYATDIQEKMIEKESLSKAATTDGLTGLLNKVTALALIDQQIRFGGALFIIDVDNFKHVNDTYGHATGDLILHAIAEQIQHVFRKDDILGRYGGDEFIAFLPSKSLNKDRLDILSATLCDRCHNSLNIDIDGNFSISVGVVIALPEQYKAFEAAFKIADSALYESKKKGKGTYTIY